MEDHEEDIATFQAITGADHETAEHVLEAHGWDLNRGVNFYMESSAAGIPEPTQTRTWSPVAPASVAESDDEVIDVTTKSRPPSVGAATEAAEGPPDLVFDDDNDAMLTAALTASLRTENGAGGLQPARPRVSPRQSFMDEDDEDEESVPPQSQSYEEPTRRPRRNTRSGSQRASTLEDIPGGRIRRNRPRGAAAPDPIMGFLGSNGRDWPPPLLVDGRLPDGVLPMQREAQEEEDDDNALPNMPAEINVEEARMLEAAFLGIPYEGRIPDFSQAEASEPTSPSVMRGRQLRQEQDQAYQDSLQADKIKADAVEAERRAASKALQHEEAARQSAAEAQRSYEQDIEEKLLRLPQEPTAGEPDAITVLIRSPKGQKFGRRFRRSDLFSDLFSFVDVSGAPDFKPDQYKLVTQFPRRAFESRREGTLQDAGLTQKQEALFLEPL